MTTTWKGGRRLVKFGICKECMEEIHIGKCTDTDGWDIWECPWCDYPHNIYDFLDIWET